MKIEDIDFELMMKYVDTRTSKDPCSMSHFLASEYPNIDWDSQINSDTMTKWAKKNTLIEEIIKVVNEFTDGHFSL